MKNSLHKTAVVRPTKFSAFTLIEMLVVVAILAAIVAILIPAFVRVHQQERHACAPALHLNRI